MRRVSGTRSTRSVLNAAQRQREGAGLCWFFEGCGTLYCAPHNPTHFVVCEGTKKHMGTSQKILLVIIFQSLKNGDAGEGNVRRNPEND